MTTELLAQVRASIEETSWGDKPAGFLVSAGTDGTVDLLITFSARAEAIAVEVLPARALDESQPSPSRVRIGGNVLAASLVQQVPPVYPQVAKDNRIQGVVVLEINVATNGTVSDAKVITGAPLLVQPALDAVRQWVYKPVLLNGHAFEAVSTVTLNFALPQ